MVLVMVERESEEPFDFEALVEQETKGGWCLDLRNVKYLYTYLSRDRRRMICVYEAPDAESVREAERMIGMPMARVWTADRMA